MINMGEGLLAQSTYSNWPKDLPLLMYHAEQDKVTDPRASKEFYDKVDITDKHYQEFKVGLLEPHMFGAHAVLRACITRSTMSTSRPLPSSPSSSASGSTPELLARQARRQPPMPSLQLVTRLPSLRARLCRNRLASQSCDTASSFVFLQ